MPRWPHARADGNEAQSTRRRSASPPADWSRGSWLRRVGIGQLAGTGARGSRRTAAAGWSQGSWRRDGIRQLAGGGLASRRHRCCCRRCRRCRRCRASFAHSLQMWPSTTITLLHLSTRFENKNPGFSATFLRLRIFARLQKSEMSCQTINLLRFCDVFDI